MSNNNSNFVNLYDDDDADDSADGGKWHPVVDRKKQRRLKSRSKSSRNIRNTLYIRISNTDYFFPNSSSKHLVCPFIY